MSRWLLIPIALGLLWFFQATLRQFLATARRLKSGRAAALDQLAARMQGARIVQDPSGHPRLTGRHRDHSFDIRLIPDSLSFRKLPALWLMITLREPQPVPGEARIMARASGLEPFSTFAGLPLTVALPPAFPQGCTLKLDRTEALPPADVMADLARGFADPAWKEAVIGAKGLRLVLLAEEADRVPYLIYREAGLGLDPIPADRALGLMDRLIALSEKLNG